MIISIVGTTTYKTLSHAAVLRHNTIKTLAGTAALETYGPMEVIKVNILLPHELIEVTYSNILNMKTIPTILLPILAKLLKSVQKLSLF